MSPEGDRAINGTPPIWQRYLPFWASNLVERMWLVVGGLLVLMLPLSRVVPPLYPFRVRSARVPLVCAAARHRGQGRCKTGSERGRTEVPARRPRPARPYGQHSVAVPLSYADELYALRNNIYAVRKRVLARAPQGSAGGAGGGAGPTTAANDAA